MALATEGEVKDLRRTVRKLEEEVAKLRTETPAREHVEEEERRQQQRRRVSEESSDVGSTAAARFSSQLLTSDQVISGASRPTIRSMCPSGTARYVLSRDRLRVKPGRTLAGGARSSLFPATTSSGRSIVSKRST